jgi:Fe-S-cluster containining protein
LEIAAAAVGAGGDRMTVHRILGRRPAAADRPEHATALVAECATCPGHCCKNDLIVLHPELGDLVATYETITVPHPFRPVTVHALDHKPNGDCVYLEHDARGVGRCGVYERRPVICRKFDCGRSYASMSRAERRRGVRAGMIGVETLEQGRRVLEARAKAER